MSHCAVISQNPNKWFFRYVLECLLSVRNNTRECPKSATSTKAVQLWCIACWCQWLSHIGSFDIGISHTGFSHCDTCCMIAFKWLFVGTEVAVMFIVLILFRMIEWWRFGTKIKNVGFFMLLATYVLKVLCVSQKIKVLALVYLSHIFRICGALHIDDVY